MRPSIKWVSISIHTIIVLRTRKSTEKCTIVWYVDDLKVVHMDTEVVRNILRLIKLKFEGEIAITIGK